MSFTQWLLDVEGKLGFTLGERGSIEALRHYREGWSTDDYAFEVENELEYNAYLRFNRHFSEDSRY
jgi:hypothetical protein